MSDSFIHFEDDERQGLIFNFNYNDLLLEYCSSFKDTSNKRRSIFQQKHGNANALTSNIIASLTVFSNYEEYDPLVSNISISKTHKDIIDVDKDLEPRRAFPKWVNTNHDVKSFYIQKALAKQAQETGRSQYAITIRISPSLARKAMTEGGAGYIQNRLAIQLKRKLGYSPDMWLHLEAVIKEKSKKDDVFDVGSSSTANKRNKRNKRLKARDKMPISKSKGCLHIHGSIAIHQSDVKAVKQVVRNLNSSSNSSFLNHELDLKPIYDELGWVTYCHKHQLLNNMLLKGTRRYVRTKALGSIAQKIYEADRRQYKSELSDKRFKVKR